MMELAARSTCCAFLRRLALGVCSRRASVSGEAGSPDSRDRLRGSSEPSAFSRMRRNSL